MEKHRDMDGEGKGDSPGYQSQPNSLETHPVRKGGDIGHQGELSPWINE